MSDPNAAPVSSTPEDLGLSSSETHSTLTSSEAATMAGWIKEDLASGKLTPEAAAKAFDELGATPEQRAPDNRTEEQKLVDAHFPPGRPGQYSIPLYLPGEDPAAITNETREGVAKAHQWLSAAGASVEQGNSIVASIVQALQRTASMSSTAREADKDQENEKIFKIYGGLDQRDAALKPAQRMIDELDRQIPGVKEFVKKHGDNWLFVTQLAHLSRNYDVRRGRKG